MLNIALITQGAEEHLAERVAGQGAAGLEAAVFVAADDASSLAVSNHTSKSVVQGHILIGCGGGGNVIGRFRTNQQGDDDLRGSATSQFAFRTEITLGVTGDDSQTVQDRHGFLVLDFIFVGEIFVLGGAGADRDQRHGHDNCQHQGQEFLHETFLLIRFAKRTNSRHPFQGSCRG